MSCAPACRKTAITTRILSLVHELCLKQINVTKRDLFYTDVKLFEVSWLCALLQHGALVVGVASCKHTLWTFGRQLDADTGRMSTREPMHLKRHDST
jgi:meiotic recombination protein SPO11